MYFEALNGTTYPSSLIVEISEVREVTFTSGEKSRTGEVHAVELSTGLVVEVHAYRVQELLRAPDKAFAAAPGTYVVSPGDGDTIKWPVIGWSVSRDGGVYPVTMNGVNEGLAVSTWVLLPTGEVTGYDSTFLSLDHWTEKHDPSDGS